MHKRCINDWYMSSVIPPVEPGGIPSRPPRRQHPALRRRPGPSRRSLPQSRHLSRANRRDRARHRCKTHLRRGRCSLLRSMVSAVCIIDWWWRVWSCGSPGRSLSTLTEGLSAWRLITFSRPHFDVDSLSIRYAFPPSFALFPASGTELTQGEQACFTVPAGLARCLLSHRS